MRDQHAARWKQGQGAPLLQSGVIDEPLAFCGRLQTRAIGLCDLGSVLVCNLGGIEDATM
jgi:hypothetical protein